jgi:hypothetical protein
VARIMVELEENEKHALWILAERERRDPRGQAALLIRSGLEKAGLLQPVHDKQDRGHCPSRKVEP